LLEMLRGDATTTRRAGETVVELGRKLELALLVAEGAVCSAWACARLSDNNSETTELRRAIAAYSGQGNRVYMPLFQGELAALEAERGSADEALALIDEALAIARETGEHSSDAFLHRLRGEILLKRDGANTGPGEEAFLTAIAVAKQQKAKSFELRAALSLAKLYQSTGRPAEAQAVLASALQGSAPTPEFPEIGAAQALLAALADTDAVKTAATARHRRLKCQTSLGNARIAARGHGAPESSAAFARASELSVGVDDPLERLSANYGVWVGNLSRAEADPLRAITGVILRDIEGKPASPEAAVAYRLAGVTEWYLGNFELARAHLGQTLAMFDPQRDRDLTYRFGQDVGVSAMVIMALALW